MARVYARRLSRPLAVRARTRLLPARRHRAEREQDWKSYAKSVLVFSAPFFGLLYGCQRAPGAPVSQPRQPRRRPVAHRVEHGDQLRHQHELAVLRRRVHDVVPDPDGRAGRAELRLGRGRDGSARGGDSRLLAALASELGNFWLDLYRSLVYILLPLAIVLAVILRLAGRRPDLPRPRDGAHARGRARRRSRAAPPLADRDQAARHERRRLLQLELGRAVREPERADELPRGARDPSDPGGAGVHVREDGAGAPARLDGLRGDVRHLRDRRRHRAAGRAARLQVLRASA